MKPTRESIFQILALLEQAGNLPEDGPTSIFVTQKNGVRSHAAQYAVTVSGDTVFVRVNRLPFARPMAFSRQALRIAEP